VDIAAWLRDLGLERYEQAFLDNDVHVGLLPDLSEADLEKLGVASLGHRKVLLRAIEVLRPPAAEAAGGTAIADEASQARPSPASRAEAERRQLTVIFVDLVGSTELSASLDPEDMREVIRAYQDTCAGIITRFEGFVAKFMGDGVLAYFGYPKAHEDEAERAVRAGLALAEAIARLTTTAGEPLSARIGMATGVVVVGDLIGEGAAQEQAVVGDTPNLAARLQGLAEPGQVVIAESTRRLLGDLFEVEDLGAQTLKGIVAPAHPFAVLRERALESRFEAHRGSVVRPLVGREHELALLLERWRQASVGEGQLVLLSGEAGIGKSRITRALIDAVAEGTHIRVNYQCSPYHSESSLWPVAQQLSHAARLTPDDPAEVKLAKLATLLARAKVEMGDAPALLARLLGIDRGERSALSDWSPQQLRAQTLNALLDQLVGLSRQSPVLLILEDAHWIDPTTLEMVGLALDRIGGERVMLLITARPTFEHAFGGHPIVTRLALNRLGAEQTRAIALQITGGKTLPESVLAEIAAKTDGVPLFVEELTKTVIESGYLDEGADAYTLEAPLPPAVIPSSLHDSLMARLDRLQPLKQVAQTAACIGRSFDYRLLAAISALPQAELTHSLDGLVRAELVFRRGLDPEAAYTFKHALVRDAAYESLLRSRRREIHQAILAWLETDGALPEVLAYHAQEAGLADQAIAYWQTAGEQALARPAYTEALKHFETALGMLREQPESESRQRREAGFLLLIGQARIPSLGYAAEATVAAFAEAERITRALHDPELRFPALYGAWTGHYVRDALPAALEQANAFCREAEALNAIVPQMIGRRIRGTTLVNMGRVREARAELEAAKALYDPKLHVALAHRFGQEPGVANDCYLTLAWALDGALDSAVRLIRTTISRLDDINHVNTTGYAFGHLGLFAAILKVPDLAVELAERGLELAKRQQLPLWEGFALSAVGLCRLSDDRFSEAAAAIAESLILYRRTGSSVLSSPFYAYRAFALSRCGRLAEAHEQLDEAHRIVADNEERWCEPEVWRIEGLLALDAGDQHVAEARFQDALASARQLGLHPWELRATTTLARLWAEQGKLQEAHGLLHPVYAGFTEGFDLPDLKDAKALLDELA
jgi:class 3 adenylate cyclase/tetratricopeptide (TPR) repeat protein